MSIFRALKAVMWWPRTFLDWYLWLAPFESTWLGRSTRLIMRSNLLGMRLDKRMWFSMMPLGSVSSFYAMGIGAKSPWKKGNGGPSVLESAVPKKEVKLWFGSSIRPIFFDFLTRMSPRCFVRCLHGDWGLLRTRWKQTRFRGHSVSWQELWNLEVSSWGIHASICVGFEGLLKQHFKMQPRHLSLLVQCILLAVWMIVCPRVLFKAVLFSRFQWWVLCCFLKS